MSHPISTFDALRESYEKFWRNDQLAAGTREELAYYDWVLNLLQVKPATRVLDIACGGGHCMDRAHAKQTRALGIDIAFAALQRAQANYHLSELAQASAETLPFADATFDYVTCLGSLEHFLAPGQAIGEMKRVLKPGGLVCIVLPNMWSFLDVIRGWRHGLSLTHSQDLERFYSLQEAKDTLTAGGLTIERIEGYNKPSSGPSGSELRKLGFLNYLYHSTYHFWRRFIPLTASYSFVFICSIR